MTRGLISIGLFPTLMMSRLHIVTFGYVSIVRVILGFKLSLHREFVVSVGMGRKRLYLKTSKPRKKIALKEKIGDKYLRGNRAFNEDKWVDKSK